MIQYELKQQVLELNNVDNKQWFNEINDLITKFLKKSAGSS